ncbi:MGMT family protein [Kocuria flava]|uniref:MGMT family protein n=1 Tax=Kocuria flava TaxID=446860 RepID=UPI000C79C8DA|nr:MGMT family protein [Kocuria flava]
MTAPGGLALRVARIVAAIPAGHVLTYGDVAELAECRSARLVGTLMARNPTGAELPWWRVVTAQGTLPPHLRPEARERWRDEGTPVRGSGDEDVRADLARARWTPEDGVPGLEHGVPEPGRYPGADGPGAGRPDRGAPDGT